MAAALAKAAIALGPAVYDGLSHEWDVMKQDRTPMSFKVPFGADYYPDSRKEGGGKWNVKHRRKIQWKA